MTAFSLARTDATSIRWLDHSLQQETSANVSLRLMGEVPAWLAAASERILELAALPAVDPRGSRPMNPLDVRDALLFMLKVMTMRDDLPTPWIGRLASGGIQMTWRSGPLELESVFDRARGDRQVIVTDESNEWDAPADVADSLLATVIDRMAALHFEQASA